MHGGPSTLVGLLPRVFPCLFCVYISSNSLIVHEKLQIVNIMHLNSATRGRPKQF